MGPTSPPRIRSRIVGYSSLFALLLLLTHGALASASPPAEKPTHGVQKGAAHGDAHGGAHGGGHGHHPAPINWTSWDYKGPDATQKYPPLLFAIINFALLVWILVKFGRKPLTEYLRNRHEQIRRDLAEAAELRDEARAKLKQIDAKLDSLDKEIAEIRESVAKDAEEEKARIVAAAEGDADAIVASAEKTLDQEIARARRKLEVGAIRAAVEAAEKILERKITEADRERIRGEYLDQIAQSGGRN